MQQLTAVVDFLGDRGYSESEEEADDENVILRLARLIGQCGDFGFIVVPEMPAIIVVEQAVLRNCAEFRRLDDAVVVVVVVIVMEGIVVVVVVIAVEIPSSSPPPPRLGMANLAWTLVLLVVVT